MTARRRRGARRGNRAENHPEPESGVREGSCFPGPRGIDVALRVVFAGSAYADLIGHAKSSLDAEICGVLVGRVAGDDEGGPVVRIGAIIHGDKAREASTHVTFTQETWVHIHEILDRDHPKMEIVGWYHTHPGFGVEFSEMDLFVHQNFFPGATQIALVTDPLSGEVAILFNASEGSARLDHFWVDHRELRCQMPAREPAEAAMSSDTSAHLRVLEEKLEHFLRTAEEQRNELLSWLMATGALITVALLLWIGSSIYGVYSSNRGLPDLVRHGSIPVAVELEGKTVILDAQIVGLEIANDRGREELPTAEAEGDGEPPPEAGSRWRRYLPLVLLTVAAVGAIWVIWRLGRKR